MALLSVLMEILRRPTIMEVVGELMVFAIPLLLAVIFGILVGWSWKPQWANVGRDILDSSVSNDSKVAVSSSNSMIPNFSWSQIQLPTSMLWTSSDGLEKEATSLSTTTKTDSSREKLKFVNEEDLRHLYRLVEEKDGGPAWIQMMDRSTSSMSYQAWRRDPETGPPQYRSRTVYEDATPEMLRDFFWDDSFRLKWDDMLIDATTLEKCSTSGTMLVHWVRRFPFFCSDREYVIGRRIWESGRSYYCVTKGVPCSSVPRRNKPRRVDLYYSSWCIRAVKSIKGNGQLTACEVLLFHHEDMGIPWEIAKLGVRQGMWGAVKKIDPGLRAYQKERASGSPVSDSAFMAQINTEVSSDYLRYLDSTTTDSLEEIQSLESSAEKPSVKNVRKLLVVGGGVLLACTLDRGLLTKALIFGVARRFAKSGTRL